MERTYYSLNQSQNSIMLQFKFTMFKRVINILSSMSFDGNADWDVMEKAFNLAIERNDSLRLRFEKQGKELKQYFIEKADYIKIPRLKFKTREEFDSFVLKNRKKAIPFMKGTVVEPYFIENYDGKNMVYMKVCHLVLDMYGIGLFFNDLMNVYKALVNNTEMPKQLGSFETLLQKDLKKVLDPEIHRKDYEFFDEFLDKVERPSYFGPMGNHYKPLNKKRAKGERTVTPDFLVCNTNNEIFTITGNAVSEVLGFSESTGLSTSVLLNYCYALTDSLINGFPSHLYVCDICNCRGTVLEKITCGTKAKNSVAFLDIDWAKSFKENTVAFSGHRNEMLKHVGFSDMDFSILLSKKYKHSPIDSLASYAYSFINLEQDDNIKTWLYSNGKSVIHCYINQNLDVKNNVLVCAYDYQTKLISNEDIVAFHKLYEKVLGVVLKNPDKPLKPLLEGLKENSGF